MDSVVAQSCAWILRTEANHNVLHAAVILAPSLAAFAIGKPCTKIDVNCFHVFIGHVNEFLITEIATGCSIDGHLAAVLWVLGG